MEQDDFKKKHSIDTIENYIKFKFTIKKRFCKQFGKKIKNRIIGKINLSKIARRFSSEKYTFNRTVPINLRSDLIPKYLENNDIFNKIILENLVFDMNTTKIKKKGENISPSKCLKSMIKIFQSKMSNFN